MYLHLFNFQWGGISVDMLIICFCGDYSLFSNWVVGCSYGLAAVFHIFRLLLYAISVFSSVSLAFDFGSGIFLLYSVVFFLSQFIFRHSRSSSFPYCFCIWYLAVNWLTYLAQINAFSYFNAFILSFLLWILIIFDIYSIVKLIWGSKLLFVPMVIQLFQGCLLNSPSFHHLKCFLSHEPALCIWIYFSVLEFSVLFHTSIFLFMRLHFYHNFMFLP